MVNVTGDTAPKPPLRNRFRAWLIKRRVRLEIGLLFFALFVVFFWKSIFITIHPGELGVYFKRFTVGTVMNKVYKEGLQIIPPWNRMYIYDVRVQQVDKTFEVLTIDGLNVGVSVSIRFHPVRETLPILHTEIGPNYVEKVVFPEIQSVLRVIVGQLHPEEVFTTQHDILQVAVAESLLQVSEKYIALDDLLITNFKLPPLVQAGIERKLVRQQIALEYQYRLMEAEQEAKRKKIEAQGINDFQRIISDGISTELLRWRGIEATLELAKSNNAKVVIIGGTGDGLPLIFNTGNDSSAAGMPRSATASINDSTEYSSLMFGSTTDLGGSTWFSENNQ